MASSHKEQMPILESQQLQEPFSPWGQQQPAVCPPQGSLPAAPLRRGLSINAALPVLTAGCPLEAFLCGCTRLLQECTVPPRTWPLPCASTKVSGCEGGRRAVQCSRGWLQSPASPRAAEGTCSREQSHSVLRGDTNGKRKPGSAASVHCRLPSHITCVPQQTLLM